VSKIFNAQSWQNGQLPEPPPQDPDFRDYRTRLFSNILARVITQALNANPLKYAAYALLAGIFENILTYLLALAS